MKKIFISFLLAIVTISTLLAQDITPKLTAFGGYYGKDDIAGMDRTGQETIVLAPDNYAGYAFRAYAAVLKNEISSAESYINKARQLNPVDQGSYGIAAYIQFMLGNVTEAQKLMDFSFQIRSDETLLSTTLADIIQIERLTKVNLSVLKEMTSKTNSKSPDAVKYTSQLKTCQNAWYAGKPSALETSVLSYFKRQVPKNPMAIAHLDYLKGSAYYAAKKWDEAKIAFNTFVNNPTIANETDKNYLIAQAYFYLSYYDEHNTNYVYANVTKALSSIAKLGFSTQSNAQLLHRKAITLGNLNKKNEQLQVAQELLAAAKKMGYTYMMAQANNTLGSYYVMSAQLDDRQKAQTYLSTAYNQAKQINDPELINLIAGNYAISLWQQGKKQDAINVATAAYNYAVQQKDYPNAQVTANNLGFMSFMEKDYSNSATLFSKAVNITENYRKNLDAAQQLEMMNEHTSAYGGLIMSLQKLNNVNELFKAQDMNRGRLLRDKLNKKASVKSVAETQKMLKPDEVLLYYSEAAPGEMIVSIITNNTASIGYNYPVEMWLKLKKTYLNLVLEKPNSVNSYITKLNEEVLDGRIVKYNDPAQGFKAKDYTSFVSITQELLKSYEPSLKSTQTSMLKIWYDFLIKPIESKIAGKKTLIISGEGSLNYLPFEAFVNNAGKYLIENYNIKYIPSATVWAQLQDRNYSDSRKPLLALGGATYQEPQKNAGNIRGIASYLDVQNDITSKINANKNNLSTELKALGFGGAKYLPGTLREVQNLQKIIPNATVLTDNAMKESDIKRLNASGDLANYKWLHIATHGFAMDNIPELSGVMMTQPANGDGNEDMFLLTHEIAALNLKADLAILSACETALGKIYGGEGINGLNSALLVAGSNNTLLSLWPVSDAGTMIMMTVLYDNLYIKKQSVNEAVNNTKREMLKGTYGQQFATPVIWAPFILSGR